jgi:hypothetical protein
MSGQFPYKFIGPGATDGQFPWKVKELTFKGSRAMHGDFDHYCSSRGELSVSRVKL